MSEEKIEEKQEEKKAEPAGQPKPAEAAAAAPEAKPAEKKAEPKKEKPANCAGCNKSIRKKRWYYRDGKFYCTKRCWQTAAKKLKAEPKPQA